MKLSPYTIASNCVDINDVDAGIAEIKDHMDQCYRSNKKVGINILKRLAKLNVKKYKLPKS